jgi:hypothetical protein
MSAAGSRAVESPFWFRNDHAVIEAIVRHGTATRTGVSHRASRLTATRAADPIRQGGRVMRICHTPEVGGARPTDAPDTRPTPDINANGRLRPFGRGVDVTHHHFGGCDRTAGRYHFANDTSNTDAFATGRNDPGASHASSGDARRVKDPDLTVVGAPTYGDCHVGGPPSDMGRVGLQCIAGHTVRACRDMSDGE